MAASVSSAALHPTASVLASCSGAKIFPDVYDDAVGSILDGASDSTSFDAVKPEKDNSLKIWVLQEAGASSFDTWNKNDT